MGKKSFSFAAFGVIWTNTLCAMGRHGHKINFQFKLLHYLTALIIDRLQFIRWKIRSFALMTHWLQFVCIPYAPILKLMPSFVCRISSRKMQTTKCVTLIVVVRYRRWSIASRFQQFIIYERVRSTYLPFEDSPYVVTQPCKWLN